MEYFPDEILVRIFKTLPELYQTILAYPDNKAFQQRLQAIFNDLLDKYTTRGIILETLKSGVVFDQPIENYGVNHWIRNMINDGYLTYEFVRYYLNRKDWNSMGRMMIIQNDSSYYLYELIRDDPRMIREVRRASFQYSWNHHAIGFLIDASLEPNLDVDYYVKNTKTNTSIFGKSRLFPELIRKIRDGERLIEIPVRDFATEYIIGIYGQVSADTYLVLYPKVIGYYISGSFTFSDFRKLYFKDKLPRFEESNSIEIFESGSGLLPSDFLP